MIVKQNIERLESLNLSAMARCYEQQQKDPAVMDWSFDERLAQMSEAQAHDNIQKRLERLIRGSKLPITQACIEDMDFNPARGLDKSRVASLNTMQWLDFNQHLVFVGATGTGKTYMACAYAMQCVRRGQPVLYKRLSRLFEELDLARALGKIPSLRASLKKPKLLILDDRGLAPLAPQHRHELLEIIEERSNTGSLAITSQLPVKKWHDYIGDPTLADAIMDRLVHRAHVFNLRGDSMRKLTANLEVNS